MWRNSQGHERVCQSSEINIQHRLMQFMYKVDDSLECRYNDELFEIATSCDMLAYYLGYEYYCSGSHN